MSLYATRNAKNTPPVLLAILTAIERRKAIATITHLLGHSLIEAIYSS